MSETQEREILNAASTLFQKYGIRKTTMEDIAGGASMGKSSLYYYFKSKEAVYEAVLREQFVEFKYLIKSGLEGYESSQELITAFIKLVYSRIFDFPALIDALLHSEEGKASIISRAVSTEFEQWQLDMIEKLLRHGVDRQEFREMEESELVINSQAIGIAMFGVRSILINEKDKSAFENKIDSLIYLLLHGIGKV